MKDLPSISLTELIRTMIGTTVVGAVMLVFAIGLSAFAGGTSDASEDALGQDLATAGPGAVTLEEGWAWYENSKENYTIALPSVWKRIDLEPQAIDASIKEVAQENSQLVGLLTPLTRQIASSGVGFLAIDSSEDSTDTRYITNVSILKRPLEPAAGDLESFAQANLKRLEGMETIVKPVEHSQTRVLTDDAEVFEYGIKPNSKNETADQVVIQYAVIAENNSYLITFTTPFSLGEKYAPIFHKSAASFHLIGSVQLDPATGAVVSTGPGASTSGTSGNTGASGNSTTRDSSPSGVVQGQVTDATTGRPIAGAVVRIKGSSISAKTDGGGSYQLMKVPVGERRVVASSDRYISLEEDIQVDNNLATPMVFTLSPKLKTGEVRIVLTWGSSPQDLDAHLWLPNENQSHIYYISERRGSLEFFPFSKIDVDAKEGNGPETITIGKLYEGSYSYSVNQFSSDSKLGDSGAVVRVYSGDSLIHTFEAPKGEGRWWRVFTIDGATRTVKPENVLAKDNPAPYPG